MDRSTSYRSTAHFRHSAGADPAGTDRVQYGELCRDETALDIDGAVSPVAAD